MYVIITSSSQFVTADLECHNEPQIVVQRIVLYWTIRG